MFDIIKIVYGIIFVLFLPGFVATFIFFPLGKIDHIERIAISFALSIAIVPLMVFYMNLLGIPINSSTVSLQIVLLMTLMLLVLFIKHFWKKRS